MEGGRSDSTRWPPPAPRRAISSRRVLADHRPTTLVTGAQEKTSGQARLELYRQKRPYLETKPWMRTFPPGPFAERNSPGRAHHPGHRPDQ